MTIRCRDSVGGPEAEGEKATLYHLAREKKNGAKSSLTKLKIKEKVAWECFDSCNGRSSTDVNPQSWKPS